MATQDELLQQWAAQNGADYNLLASAQNGNTQTTTTNNPTQSEMDAMKDLYPNLQYPSDYNNTNTTTTTTTSTPTNTVNTTSNAPGYDAELAAWAQQNGADYNLLYYSKYGVYPTGNSDTTTTPTNPTTNPTNPTNPTTPTTTTPTTTDTTPTTTPTTQTGNGPGYDAELAAWAAANGADYNLLYYAKYGVYPSSSGTPTTPGSDTPSSDTTPTTNTTGNDPGYDAQLAAWAAANGADYRLLYYAKYGVYPSESGTPGSGTPGSNIPGSNVTHNYPSVDTDNRQRISNMYDAQIEAQRAALQEQGDQALSDAQANRDKIASLYNKQRNAASVDWERQRRNFLEGANTSGINTGAGSQAELSMMSMYQRAQNDLGAAQAQAEADADRNIADIKRSTQASINEAIAKNDYQKAAALLDEYNAEYNRAVERAEALGQYGDFSGYAALYGDEAAAQMRYTWIMSNPEIALAMGQITQQQYAQLALYKQYPALALSGGAGGGYGGGGNGYGGVDYDNQGHSTAAIAAIQQTLQNAGYYNGNVDGLAGDQTNAAIAAWNNDHPDNPLHL